MRRPHRSIETFDISLMAVVTKAMGAFLVLMLLLMPYYSSGPIGQKAAGDLADKVQQADRKIREVIGKLNTASYEDLRKLLDDALQMLDDARKLVAELKRANDALQAQVKRLEEQVATLQSKIAPLEARNAQLQSENAALQSRIAPLERENASLKDELSKFTGNKMMVVVTNAECNEDIAVQIYDPDSYVTLPGGQKSKDLLNFSGARPRDVIGARNFTIFATGGFSPGPYYLVAQVQKRDAKVERLKSGAMGIRLAAAAADCSIMAGLSVQFTREKGYTYPLRRIQVLKGDHAVLIGELAVKKDDLDWLASPSEATRSWFADQVKNAVKDD